MQFARLRLALPLIACVLASSDAAEVQETGAEGVFLWPRSRQGGRARDRLADDRPQRHLGCMPAMEMMFRVRAPEVSRDLQARRHDRLHPRRRQIRYPGREARLACRVKVLCSSFSGNSLRTPTKSRPSALETAVVARHAARRRVLKVSLDRRVDEFSLGHP